MNNAFRFNSSKDDRNEYLTRMAIVIDSINTGKVIPGIGDSYREILSEAEKQEVKNYVFEVMLPIIREEGNFYIKKTGIQDMAESYLNNLYLEVWENFPKYNNPAYKGTDGRCAFRTFVKVYTRNPGRKTIDNEKGQSKKFGYKKSIIRKTQAYIAVKYGLDPEDITSEEIREFLPEVSATMLSIDTIDKMLDMMQARVDLEECDNLTDGASEMDDLFIATDAVMDSFREFMDRLRPLQKFIFCQSHGFCSEKYDDITLEQLSCDPDFLKIVKDDHIAARHLTRSDMEIREPRYGGFPLGRPIYLKNVEHIDVNFLTHQRVRCNKLIIAFVTENHMDEYDVQASLAALMRETWDELAEEYGLE